MITENSDDVITRITDRTGRLSTNTVSLIAALCDPHPPKHTLRELSEIAATLDTDR